MAIREVTIKSGQDGDFLRDHIFTVRRCGSGRRNKKEKPTPAGQAKYNQKKAVHKLVDLLQHNFTPADIWLNLDYLKDVTLEEALKYIKNLINRIKYKYKTRNLGKLKYVYTTEVGAVNGRLHHHLVISGKLSRDELKEMWKHGGATSYKIEFSETGLTGLAKYMCQDTDSKDPNARLTYRRWSSSTNLDKPEPKKNDYRISAKVAKYINDHPDDFAYVQKLYQGYMITKIETTADSFAYISSPDDTDKDIKARGIFITIYGYKQDTKLFGRKRGDRFD